MQPTLPIQINIVDATPGALGRWSARCRGQENLSFRTHSSPPRLEDGPSTGLWILAPDSMANPSLRNALIEFASENHPHAEVMVVHNIISQLPHNIPSANTVWIDAREPERSIVRTLSLLIRSHRNRLALAEALNAPIEAENQRIQLEQDSRNKDEFLATMSH